MIISPFTIYGSNASSKGIWNSIAVRDNILIGIAHGSTNTTASHKPLAYSLTEEKWFTEKVEGYSLQSEIISGLKYYKSDRLECHYASDEDGNGATRFVKRVIVDGEPVWKVRRCGPDGHNRDTIMFDDGERDWVIILAGQIYDDLYLSKDGGETFVEWGNGSTLKVNTSPIIIDNKIYFILAGGFYNPHTKKIEYLNEIHEFILDPSNPKRSKLIKVGSSEHLGNITKPVVVSNKLYYYSGSALMRADDINSKPVEVFKLKKGYVTSYNPFYARTLIPYKNKLFALTTSTTHSTVYLISDDKIEPIEINTGNAVTLSFDSNQIFLALRDGSIDIIDYNLEKEEVIELPPEEIPVELPVEEKPEESVPSEPEENPAQPEVPVEEKPGITLELDMTWEALPANLHIENKEGTYYIKNETAFVLRKEIDASLNKRIFSFEVAGVSKILITNDGEVSEKELKEEFNLIEIEFLSKTKDAIIISGTELKIRNIKLYDSL